METAGIVDAQHKGREPLVFGIPEFGNNAAFQLAELVGAVLVVLFEFRRILLENHLEGRVTPGCFCRARGIIGIKVLDVLADGDERATVTSHGTVTGLNKLTDLLIFEVEQLPAFVDGAALLQAARRAVHLVLNVDDEGKHYRNQQIRLVLQTAQLQDNKAGIVGQ